jgi:hypothetical protein
MADKKISALTGATTPLAGTEVLPIVQSGATVKVAVSNLTAGRIASANGIAFPATQSASADANTLDDYEEGTWTPTLKGDGGNADQTYSVQAGYYTKVGNLLSATFRVILTNVGTPSGSAILGGLPFVVKDAIGTSGGSISNYVNLGTPLASLTIFPVRNTSFCYFYGVVVAATSQTNIGINLQSNTTILIGSVTYFV